MSNHGQPVQLNPEIMSDSTDLIPDDQLTFAIQLVSLRQDYVS
jgi:hypothetical protein